MIKVNGYEIEVGHFPDGTQHIVMEEGYAFNSTGTNDIVWLYENDSEMATLMYVVDWLGEEDKNALYLPYVPNARMDRVKENSDVFTLKSFCRFINLLGFSEVYILDPHSDVTPALLKNVTVLSAQKYIEEVIKNLSNENLLLFYPDAGASKRYSGFFDIPFCYGVKNRDWKSGKILGLEVFGQKDMIKDHDILIIDDICSRGGTFYHSAKKLKELGAKNVYLYVTHCEKTILEGEIFSSGLIEKVFTTNSIFNIEHEKVEVLNCE